MSRIVLKKHRGDIYRFLAAFFYIPPKKMLLQERVFENLISALKQASPEATEFSIKMQEALLDETEERMAVDYSKLFVGPFELQAPPYGSFYLEKGKRVMGDSTIEVLKMYNDLGLSIDSDFKEMPDHIAVELEFMYYLIEKEVQALEEPNLNSAPHFIEAQEFFLSKFLNRWVPPFCKRIKENTENEFYKALADCVLIFLKNEMESIRADQKDVNSELIQTQ